LLITGDTFTGIPSETPYFLRLLLPLLGCPEGLRDTGKRGITDSYGLFSFPYPPWPAAKRFRLIKSEMKISSSWLRPLGFLWMQPNFPVFRPEVISIQL
jgi:hypothetical protein